jgi:hypothetical protein
VTAQSPFDQQKWAYEQNRALAERAHDNNQDFFNRINEATVNAGNLALRMALLINGGAAVALLSFVNGLDRAQKVAVADSLVWFAWGVFAAAIGIGLAYFTNFCMVGIASSRINKYEPPYVEDGPSTPKWQQWNRHFHVTAVFFATASLMFFVTGMLCVQSAIKLP